MRVYREFSNSQSLANLDSTKVIALLDLPSEDREEFTATPHTLASGETKTFDDMITRESMYKTK